MLLAAFSTLVIANLSFEYNLMRLFLDILSRATYPGAPSYGGVRT